MQTEVYESFDVLKDIQQEWDDFIEANGADIFMTYDWCRIWWKYYGMNRNLKVFVFSHEDEIIGIIPLFIEKIWFGPVFVRAVKIVGSDFTPFQFCLPISDAFFKEVVAELGNKLHDLEWDIIHIGPIAGIYNSFVELEESLRQSFNSYAEVQSNEQEVQTYFEIKSDWESHLSSLSKNARKKIKKDYRALSKICETRGELVSCSTGSEECLDAFDGFVEMHQTHWNNLGRLGHFGDWPKSREFHKEMVRSQSVHGRLRMMVTKCGNEPLGYEYAYRFGKKYYAILNSRLEPGVLTGVSLGIPIFCEQIKMAIAEGVECIDAMRGRYEYKLRLGGKLYPMHCIYVARKGCLKEMKVKLFRLLSKFYYFCYYRVWYLKVAPKLLKKRRPLSKLLIRTQAFSK